MGLVNNTGTWAQPFWVWKFIKVEYIQATFHVGIIFGLYFKTDQLYQTYCFYCNEP